MASWTPDHSMILSLLLDTVVGTKEMIAIRQDYSKLNSCLQTVHQKGNVYFTGSKSEGLDLPGSDEDYMIDINNPLEIKVTQSLDQNNDAFLYNTLFMSTENIHPGFALLRYLHQTQLVSPVLYQVSKNMYGRRYLSSDLFVQYNVSWCRNMNMPVIQSVQRQGPSAEIWVSGQNTSESGTDHVFSIHCPFWPNESSEWVHRLRPFSWPSLQEISTITDFGFHLVPVGHPHSDTKPMEWRISFSVAERTLVWSFNHVQMQCYALMKIILKEFIKVRYNPQNQVLCSYFIKTFLFWKYETTELNFWRENNLRECIKYLLAEFSKCIQEGVLRHYFIPRFNLLSVKLTRAAQTELLQLFDIIIQSDISILKECRTLRNVWSEFLQWRENKKNYIIKNKRENLLRNDMCMINTNLAAPHIIITNLIHGNLTNIFSHILTLSCKTSLRTLVLKRCLFEIYLTSRKLKCVTGNRDVYQLCRTAQNDICSFDIPTCKLWCAILLLKRGEFLSALNIINQVLSNIPPFAIYQEHFIGTDAEQLYVAMFLNSDDTVIQRARTAWMFDFYVTKNMTDVVPLAIQIEIYFRGDYAVQLSPFTCAYYLQFLCYHRTQQYDNRDRALQQLIEVAYNRKQRGMKQPYTSLSIAAHCLLLAGRRVQARDLLYRSYMATQNNSGEIWNSAIWYLLNCF